MSFRLLIHRQAQKSLAALPRDDYDTVRDAIGSLAAHPRPRGCKKLTDRPGWRIRIGSYRVIYEIDDQAQTITVVRVGHRRDVY